MNTLALIAAGLLITGQSRADINAQSIAMNCRNCHSQTISDPKLSSLQRLSASEIRSLLLDFKYDKNTATLMPRIAKGYSDAELNAVADYLGQN